MGQIRHGCANYPAVLCTANQGRARTQSGQKYSGPLAGHCAAMSPEARATNAALSREPGVNVNTDARWRKRRHWKNRKTGPADPVPTALNSSEAAMAVAFRRLRFSFDDWLRPAVIDPTAEAFFVASLFAAAWHIPVAGYGG